MLEDLGAFFEANRLPPKEWRAPLMNWAGLAAHRALDLEVLRPGANYGVLRAALDLQTEFQAPSPKDRESPREQIATLSDYLHASATALEEYEIPEHETEATEAAQDIAWAAIQILWGMDGDYGNLDETSA